MCGDYQHLTGRYNKSIKDRGSYVALSGDEGETWIIKKLAGTLSHFEFDIYETIGYSVATQAPNGNIHIIATATVPLLHFEINEEWILQDNADWSLLYTSKVPETQVFQERYADGALKYKKQGGISDEGVFLLHGQQKWYYPRGGLKYEAHYRAGVRTGSEIYYNSDGSKQWERFHKADGSKVWTQYWPNGKMKAESNWKRYKAEGSAKRWDRTGKLIFDGEFWNGRIL